MKSREYGEIASYNGSYAFIKPDSGDRDIFAHESQLPNGRIHRGDRVSFDVVPDKYKPGKLVAVRVRFAGENPAQEDAEEERSVAEAHYQCEERTALADALRRAGLKNPDAGLEG
jgi:cold shock CspA family protein